MGFLDKLLKIVDVVLEEENENLEKGHEFEEYVVSLFSKQYFSIVDWTKDRLDKRKGTWVESNSNPDLIIRYIPTKEQFAVECKYRSSLHKSKKIDKLTLHWAKPEQIENYKRFAKEKNIPVFVVIGLGGSPSNPKSMFCIPLEEARYPELFLSLLKKYKREPDKSFFWKNQTLS